MSADAKIDELGLELPPAPKPMGVYKPLLIVNGMAYVSGHGPLLPDGSLLSGRVGAEVDQDAGYQAARQTGLAVLATLRAGLGSLDKVKRIVKTLGMVNCVPDFEQHPAVINGFSDLFAEVFGEENGVGARSAVGMGSLPGNITVEVEVIFELKQQTLIAEDFVLNRDDALQLMHEHTQGESLRCHMLAVECAMRAYARSWGEDEEKWGIVGLLHDFDYERWPNPPDHPLKGSEILRQHGYPDDVIYAIKSHADYLPDCPRVSRLDKALYACDELAGFVTAVAKVRPDSMTGMKASSVVKKLKQKSFAAAVNRDDIRRGAEDLELDLKEHIQFVIDAMAAEAESLGL